MDKVFVVNTALTFLSFIPISLQYSRITTFSPICARISATVYWPLTHQSLYYKFFFFPLYSNYRIATGLPMNNIEWLKLNRLTTKCYKNVEPHESSHTEVDWEGFFFFLS